MKTLKYIIPVLIIVGIITIAQSSKNDSISPVSSGKIEGKTINTDMNVIKPQAMDSNLRIKEIKAALLSKETNIGKEGDILLTIEGGGFLATSLNPVVKIDDLLFEETIISLDFSRLYVVINKEAAEKLKRKGFKMIEVRNPGKGFVSMEYNLEKLSMSLKGTPPEALIYTQEGIVVR